MAQPWHDIIQECVHAARHSTIFAGFLKEYCQAGVHQGTQLNQLSEEHRYRDLAAAFHDPQERVKQASQGFTICVLTVAGKQSHKALRSVLLPEAWLDAAWVLSQPGCQCIQSRALPHLHSHAHSRPPAHLLHATSMYKRMLCTCCNRWRPPDLYDLGSSREGNRGREGRNNSLWVGQHELYNQECRAIDCSNAPQHSCASQSQWRSQSEDGGLCLGQTAYSCLMGCCSKSPLL